MTFESSFEHKSILPLSYLKPNREKIENAFLCHIMKELWRSLQLSGRINFDNVTIFLKSHPQKKREWQKGHLQCFSFIFNGYNCEVFPPLLFWQRKRFDDLIQCERFYCLSFRSSVLLWRFLIDFLSFFLD